MEGRRFAVGAAAGLLFALAVIASSGAFATSGGTYPGELANHQEISTSATATTITTSSPPGYQGAVSGSTTSASPASVGTPASQGVQATSTATTTPSVAPASSPAEFSSNLDSAGQLPTTSRAILLAPILVAILLGAVIYQASVRGRAND